jgi:hypothetical protein
VVDEFLRITGSALAGFSAPTRILAVILRSRRYTGSARDALIWPLDEPDTIAPVERGGAASELKRRNPPVWLRLSDRRQHRVALVLIMDVDRFRKGKKKEKEARTDGEDHMHARTYSSIATCKYLPL